MRTRKFRSKEREEIALALNYWANYIETGSIINSAIDVQNGADEGKVKALLPGQMETIVRLRKLAGYVLSGERQKNKPTDDCPF